MAAFIIDEATVSRVLHEVVAGLHYSLSRMASLTCSFLPICPASALVLDILDATAQPCTLKNRRNLS
jgi:hypothetical protein